jgi:hypothetical protein
MYGDSARLCPDELRQKEGYKILPQPLCDCSLYIFLDAVAFSKAVVLCRNPHIESMELIRFAIEKKMRLYTVLHKLLARTALNAST